MVRAAGAHKAGTASCSPALSPRGHGCISCRGLRYYCLSSEVVNWYRICMVSRLTGVETYYLLCSSRRACEDNPERCPPPQVIVEQLCSGQSGTLLPLITHGVIILRLSILGFLKVTFTPAILHCIHWHMKNFTFK